MARANNRLIIADWATHELDRRTERISDRAA
jgi:hypothetical protein